MGIGGSRTRKTCAGNLIGSDAGKAMPREGRCGHGEEEHGSGLLLAVLSVERYQAKTGFVRDPPVLLAIQDFADRWLGQPNQLGDLRLCQPAFPNEVTND